MTRGIPRGAASGAVASGAVPEVGVRIRRSPWQALLRLTPAAILVPNVIASSTDSDRRWLVAILFTTAVTMAYLYSLRLCTELTPTHLISRWGRAKAVPWDRVQGFSVRQNLGLRTLEVVSDDGNYTALWAPSSFCFIGRAGFSAQVQVIGQWWVDHRGPQWVPMPANPWGQPVGREDQSAGREPVGREPGGRVPGGAGLPLPLRDNPWTRPT